jgi:hypothetical protein
MSGALNVYPGAVHECKMAMGPNRLLYEQAAKLSEEVQKKRTDKGGPTVKERLAKVQMQRREDFWTYWRDRPLPDPIKWNETRFKGQPTNPLDLPLRQEPSPPIEICRVCRKHTTNRCQCQKAFYCSTGCQKKDWPEHKKTHQPSQRASEKEDRVQYSK